MKYNTGVMRVSAHRQLYIVYMEYTWLTET